MSLASLVLLATLGQTPEVRIVEAARPGAGKICVQAIVKLPALTPREWGALELIRDTLPEGTETFSRSDLLNYATMAGEPMKVTLAADHLRIGYEYPRGNLRLASDVLRELLDKAYLREDAVANALESTPFRRRSSWAQALSPWRSDFTELTRNDVYRVYRRVFRPENVTVAVVGDFLANEARNEFSERFSGWNPEDPGRRRIMEGKASTPAPSSQTPTMSLMADMTGQPEVLMMTAFALGVGKGSSAFRVVREGQRISYRQEALLAPADKGWRFGLFFPYSKDFDQAKLLEALKQDIESWDDATLERSKGMLAATVDLKLGAMPVYLDPRRPLQVRLEDETYWIAYCSARKMPALPFEALRKAMETVPVSTVKETALEWLGKARFGG